MPSHYLSWLVAHDFQIRPSLLYSQESEPSKHKELMVLHQSKIILKARPLVILEVFGILIIRIMRAWIHSRHFITSIIAKLTKNSDK